MHTLRGIPGAIFHVIRSVRTRCWFSHSFQAYIYNAGTTEVSVVPAPTDTCPRNPVSAMS